MWILIWATAREDLTLFVFPLTIDIFLLICKTELDLFIKYYIVATKFDGLVKSHKILFSVIPAKAGIQSFQAVVEHLDSGFHRSDDYYKFIKFIYLKFCFL